MCLDKLIGLLLLVDFFNIILCYPCPASFSYMKKYMLIEDAYVGDQCIVCGKMNIQRGIWTLKERAEEINDRYVYIQCGNDGQVYTYDISKCKLSIMYNKAHVTQKEWSVQTLEFT